jgi:hypothetical protein
MDELDRIRRNLEDVAAEFRSADSNLGEAVLDALSAGLSAAEVARVAELPYGKVLAWRRYA